jgi:hypothetical protein
MFNFHTEFEFVIYAMAYSLFILLEPIIILR